MTKYVKLRKAKLNHDGPALPSPDSGGHPPPRAGGDDAHKVRRLVEAMYWAINNREQQRWRKTGGGEGFPGKFEKVDDGKR